MTVLFARYQISFMVDRKMMGMLLTRIEEAAGVNAQEFPVFKQEADDFRKEWGLEVSSSAVVNDVFGESSAFDSLAFMMLMRELAQKEKIKKQYWERKPQVVLPQSRARGRSHRRYLAMSRKGNIEDKAARSQ